MTFSIITLGCKVNLYESEMMREKLLKHGFVEKNPADVTIINTCSVTNMADKKSKKLLRHVRKENPKTVLVVAGCSSQNHQTEYQDMNIDILLGNKEKSNIVLLIEEYLQHHEPIVVLSKERNLPFEEMEVTSFSSHTRAFLKIQDGCNNFCSYCIIPYVRGMIRSKRMEDVLREAENLVAFGHQELVLTGINTGTYGMGMGYDLADLLHELGKIDGLKYIRISSIEVTELNAKFLRELKQNQKICNHLHIPLQAGSNEILKKMNRKYDLTYFEKKIGDIRAIRPDISITTDVIVGHPYETEALFRESLDTISRIGFSKVHAFPYSKRDGTASSQMKEQVSEEEKKQRNRTLIALSNCLEKAYAIPFLKKEVDVLIEEVIDGSSYGHTSNYLKVCIPKILNRNQIYPVYLDEYQDGCVLGLLKMPQK